MPPVTPTPQSVLGQAMQGGMLQSLPANAGVDQIVQVMNQIILAINEQLQTTVLSDDSTKRYLNGYQKGGFPDGDFGMKISLPDYDVTLANDTELLFMMDYTSGTMYWYDPLTHKNYGQIGELPNGLGGFAFMQPGFNVADGIS